MDAKALIESGKTALGIELGSTRIKGVQHILYRSVRI